MLKSYQKLINENVLKMDYKQLAVIEKLDVIQAKLNRKDLKIPGKIKGIYIYGGPGTGKTMIMDMFYKELTSPSKARIHWDNMMALFLQEIHNLEGKGNLYEGIGHKVLTRSRTICLDEVQLTDYAMSKIVTGVFKHLFENNALLVATSNRQVSEISPPHDHLPKKENEEKEITFYDLLLQNCDIHNMDSSQDYRTRHKETDSSNHAYVYPICPENIALFESKFHDKIGSENPIIQDYVVLPTGRKLLVNTSSRNQRTNQFTCLFNSSFLFNTIMGISDFRAICHKYEFVFINDLPKMYPKENPDPVRRFISFLDSAYDYKTKVFILAEQPIHNIFSIETSSSDSYISDELFSLHRAISRIYEMSTSQYQALPHQPPVDLFQPSNVSLEHQQSKQLKIETLSSPSNFFWNAWQKIQGK